MSEKKWYIVVGTALDYDLDAGIFLASTPDEAIAAFNAEIVNTINDNLLVDPENPCTDDDIYTEFVICAGTEQPTFIQNQWGTHG